ncbi:hypothetical protein C0585_01215 [Candidatus Woesearchaeota archaeon]|nr:MAG: hypothetical protein C0585_01215 [Candidatus Woesearchaeota archaeon]
MDWLILAIISAFLLAFEQILQKNVLEKEHSLEFTISMFGFISLILVPNFLFMDYSAINSLSFALIGIRSILIASGFLMFTKALRHLDLSVSAPISNLSSVIVLILSFLFLGDRLSLGQLLGVFLIIFGTYSLQLNRKHSFFEPLKVFYKSKYFHYSLLSISFFGVSAILTKYLFIISNVRPFDYLHLSFLIGFLFLLFCYRFTGYPYKLILKDARKAGLIIPLISLFEIGSMFVYLTAVAIPGAMIALIIPIRRLSTLLDVIIGGRLLHETNLLSKTVSTTIILLGVFVLVL